MASQVVSNLYVGKSTIFMDGCRCHVELEFTMHTSPSRAASRKILSQTGQDIVKPCTSTKQGFSLSPANSAYILVPSLDCSVLTRG